MINHWRLLIFTRGLIAYSSVTWSLYRYRYNDNVLADLSIRCSIDASFTICGEMRFLLLPWNAGYARLKQTSALLLNIFFLSVVKPHYNYLQCIIVKSVQRYTVSHLCIWIGLRSDWPVCDLYWQKCLGDETSHDIVTFKRHNTNRYN